MENDDIEERSNEEELEEEMVEVDVAQENPKAQEEVSGKEKKKKEKHPYDIDYAKLPKGKLGRIVYEYNDLDMTWERVSDENQEWLDDEKTQLGEKVDAFFLLLVSITQKYRKEIQLEKQAKITSDEEGRGRFHLWCSDHCHKFIVFLILSPLIVSIFIGYFINIIAGAVMFAIFSLITVIMFLCGWAFDLSHKYSDQVDFHYNMEIFASLRRMEREIKKLLPEINLRSFEPLGYRWELYSNCRAFVLLKNSEYEPDEEFVIPDMQDNGTQSMDDGSAQGNDDGSAQGNDDGSAQGNEYGFQRSDEYETGTHQTDTKVLSFES